MRPVPLPEISILIVSYNTRELTIAAIDSVVRETRTPHEIIVVDNNSTDGSAEAIAKHPASPRLIAHKDNIGFARANNLAARYARAKTLLLLNPDTVVLDHAIDRLMEFAHKNPRARIWGGRTLFADGKLNPSSCWQRISVWSTFCRTSGLAAVFPSSSFFNGEAIGGWGRDSERGVDIVSGCFFMIPKSLWRELGGFDPTFYMYGEEADLCLRAHRLGARPAITPNATIVHLGGASERTRAAKMIKLLAAKTTLIERHLPVWQRPIARFLMRMWPLTRMFALSTLSHVRRSEKASNSAAEWREVWNRREEWQYGYRAVAAESTDAIGAIVNPTATLKPNIQ